MVRKFHDVCAKVHLSVSYCGEEPRGGLRLDVAGEEGARDFRIGAFEVHAHHKRAVVQARGAEVFRRPDDAPGRGAGGHRITGRDRAHRYTEFLACREQPLRGVHRIGALEEAPVDDQLTDTRVSHEVERSAVVVEVRVRHDQSVDAPAARSDKGQQPAGRDGTHAARAGVEDRQRAATLDQVRRSVADREHGELADDLHP